MLGAYKFVLFTGTLSAQTGYTQIANDPEYANAVPVSMMATADETEFETSTGFTFKNNNGSLRFNNSVNDFRNHTYKVLIAIPQN